MSYFVTGATGFIGRHLVRALLQRGRSTVYVLVRGRSLGKLDELKEFWGKDAARRVIPVKGDLAQAGLGIGKPDLRKLKGKVTHFFHLGAVYDIEASAEAMHRANILGTEHALAFAHQHIDRAPAALQERAYEVAADESGRAGHEVTHVLLPRPARRRRPAPVFASTIEAGPEQVKPG